MKSALARHLPSLILAVLTIGALLGSYYETLHLNAVGLLFTEG